MVKHRINFVCQCGNTKHCAKGYCSKCYDMTPERQRPERKKKLKQYHLSDKWKLYMKRYNHEYRKKHYSEHLKNEQDRYKKDPTKKDEQNKQWRKQNPQKWRKLVLRSQTKYLKSLEPFLNKEYNKIPYLFRSWAEEVKTQNYGLCAITDCFETGVHAHHIFHKAKYPNLSLNLNNGIPLCLRHHNESHGRF